MLRILCVFGTRPEAIKMAPLIDKLKKAPDIDCAVCVTAQHREMLDQVLVRFGIVPEFDLDLMQYAQTLTDLTTRVMQAVREVLEKTKPDLLLVHGDTTTSFAAALAAFYQQIPVGHVEAGLRSFNKYSPFPEELNRTMTAKIAELHFAPTQSNKQNLMNEGVTGRIFVTGNTVIDALLQLVSDQHVFSSPLLRSLCASDKRLILLTAHRRENLGKPLKDICHAVRRIAEDNEDVEIIYPVHLNPSVQNTVHSILSDQKRVHLVEPLEVIDMHNLIHKSYLVLTDSGGLQEEAAALGKPIIILREETERPEVREAGKALLVGANELRIYESVKRLLKDKKAYNAMQNAVNPFGDGKASERIVKAILFWAGQAYAQPKDYGAVRSINAAKQRYKKPV